MEPGNEMLNMANDVDHARHSGWRTLQALGLCGLVGLIGCGTSAGGFLTGNRSAPLAPGDNAFVQVWVVNSTKDTTISQAIVGADAPALRYDYFYLQNITQENRKLGGVLPCPVHSLRLGTTDDSVSALELSPSTGGAISVPSRAFPFALREGVDFNCGDSVYFVVSDNANSPYRVSVGPGVIDGSTQTGPFSGPDTFAILNVLLNPPTVVNTGR